MPISFECPHCQRSIKAPDSAAGKKAKCPGCAQVLEVPVQQDLNDSPVDLEPGLQDLGPGLQDLGPGLQDLGLPATDPNAFPATSPPMAPTPFATAPSQPPRKAAPTRVQLNYSPLQLATAIAAIVHWSMVTGPIFWLLGFSMFSAMFSLSGLLTFALVASSTTVLVAGIGLLCKQHWATSVGAVGGGVYLAIFAFLFVIGIISMVANGFGSIGLQFFVWQLPRTLLALSGPILFIILQQNDTGNNYQT